MQPDGNLVIYNSKIKSQRENPSWATGTQNKDTNPTLVLQDDGNLCVYSSKGQLLWATMSVNNGWINYSYD